MTTPAQFDATDLLAELDGGVFMKKVTVALKETAAGTASQEGKKKLGKVTITMEFEKIAEGSTQLAITHKLKYERPTPRGKSIEEDETDTVVHVHGSGAMSLIPFNQPQLFPKEPAKG